MPNLAVLIDAENVSPQIAEGLFREIAKLGYASVRRIYGDFTGTRLNGWSDVLPEHAIMPHQNCAQANGKNAADIALVVDAMDLLHSNRFDAFCLVSSDSDFTRLALRMREHGTDVYGFGQKNASDSFRRACKQFVPTEKLIGTKPVAVTTPAPKPAAAPKPKTSAPATKSPKDAEGLIRAALAKVTPDDKGWCVLGAVGSHIIWPDPVRKYKAYGCAQLKKLVEQLPAAFEMRATSGTPANIRLRASSAP